MGSTISNRKPSVNPVLWDSLNYFKNLWKTIKELEELWEVLGESQRFSEDSKSLLEDSGFIETMLEQLGQITREIIVIFVDVVEEVSQPFADIHVGQFAASHEGVDDGRACHRNFESSFRQEDGRLISSTTHSTRFGLQRGGDYQRTTATCIGYA